jgi:integral membrane protein (TIGR01906 family)
MKSYGFFHFLSWLISILVVVWIVLTGVRLLLMPLFVTLEYNAPGFPDDSFGFSKNDRLYWSKIALNYLLNDADIAYLGDLKFTDGQPVYNQRELRHMVDVKKVVKSALLVWYGSMVLIAGVGLWAWRGGWWEIYRIGISRGGWMTVSLLVLIIFLVLFSFNTFFVSFHNVFFQAGTWQFLYSDTLIRLFPERFWQDAFLLVGVVAIGLGIVLGLAFVIKKKSRSPDSSEAGRG